MSYLGFKFYHMITVFVQTQHVRSRGHKFLVSSETKPPVLGELDRLALGFVKIH